MGLGSNVLDLHWVTQFCSCHEAVNGTVLTLFYGLRRTDLAHTSDQTEFYINVDSCLE